MKRRAQANHTLELPGLSPCNYDPSFWAFEDQIQKVWSDRTVPREARSEFTENMTIEAERRWCGACPFKADCLQWGKDDKHTGIAGGKWLTGGEEQ